MSETESEVGITVREMESQKLADSFYELQEKMEFVVDEIRFRQEDDRYETESLPDLEDKGRFNESKTEFHLYLDLL